ncbi:MAG TPA: DUF1292 domain-containing protein [Thermoanaerobacterales bacterium]|nr:DUF1292 domain-containing protein [Thermoanaerobacterales bacterium]
MKDENTIVLHDEEGEEWAFDVIDIINVNNTDYALLLPLDEYDEEEIFVFRMEEDGKGEQILVELDDEEELLMVEEAWEKLVYEEDEIKN